MTFSITGVRAEKYAAVPSLVFRLRLEEPAEVHAVLLRCQIRIEARRRPYSDQERAGLFELFGEPGRWRDTLRSLLWTQASVTVTGFRGAAEADLAVPCTYDFEVTAAKYLEAIRGGEIPLLFLFSGTAFLKTENGYRIEQVPWEKEAAFGLPAGLWRELMDAYFPGCAWIRLRRESLDSLARFKAERALPTWEEAIQTLLETAGGSGRPGRLEAI